jgi:two-component system, LytTR family, response regulator
MAANHDQELVKINRQRLLNIEILYCEASGNYTVIYLKTKQRLLKCMTLKAIEAELMNEKYLRVHRKYLINSEYVNYIANDRTHILLADGKSIPTSRRKRYRFKGEKNDNILSGLKLF